MKKLLIVFVVSMLGPTLLGGSYWSLKLKETKMMKISEGYSYNEEKTWRNYELSCSKFANSETGTVFCIRAATVIKNVLSKERAINDYTEYEFVPNGTSRLTFLISSSKIVGRVAKANKPNSLMVEGYAVDGVIVDVMKLSPKSDAYEEVVHLEGATGKIYATRISPSTPCMNLEPRKETYGNNVSHSSKSPTIDPTENAHIGISQAPLRKKCAIKHEKQESGGVRLTRCTKCGKLVPDVMK